MKLLVVSIVLSSVLTGMPFPNVDAVDINEEGSLISGDVNCDGACDMSDAVSILNWLFLGGREPCPLADPPELVEQINHLQTQLDERDAEIAQLEAELADAHSQLAVCESDLVAAQQRISELEVAGCTDPDALNYNPCANLDDGSCIDGFDGFTFLNVNGEGYDEYTHDQTGIVFVRLPGGTFNMGSPENELFRESDEGPVHEVTVGPFLLAKYEVTKSQWELVMGEWDTAFDGDNLPVDQVSWDDIQVFEERTGLILPTEAQWEYACRAGTETAFCFGSGESCPGQSCDACGEADAFMWSCANSGDRPREVGTKQANQFGLHDLHGNVWEWCEDVYDAQFYSKPDASKQDPICTSGSENRVWRGGGWGDVIRHCRSANRYQTRPSVRGRGRGFRPALPLP